jgi:hydroxyacylglutathione hydrolase
MRVVPVPCLSDNYAYLLVADDGQTAVVDASEAGPVRAAIAAEGVTPRAIWSTHHHFDHVGGNAELSAELGVEVVGHASDGGRLPAMTHPVNHGDVVTVGNLSARCLHIPGHTLGAVAYFVDSGAERVVFTGDTLFCAGCGRLFEGTPAQMVSSLERLRALPPDTRVYCGHEYTESNLRFAASVESTDDIRRAHTRAAALRAGGKPTVGTTLEDEERTNPFLRVRSPAIRKHLGIPEGADDATSFAAIRAAKDVFR